MRKTLVALALTATALLTGAGTAAADPTAVPAVQAGGGCVADTDDEAGAMRLSQAYWAGLPIGENLDFPGADVDWPAYASDTERLADLFWATQTPGTDWDVAQRDLDDWLDDMITC